MHIALGVPVVASSAIVGTTIFATLSTQPDVGFKIVTGLLAVAAAVLAALQTFFKHSEEAEKHRVAAAKYAAVYRDLDLYCLRFAGGLGDRDLALSELDRHLTTWDQLEAESPAVPDRLYDQAVREEKGDPEGV